MNRAGYDNPAGTAERHFRDDDGPWDLAADGDRSREMQHRHKEEHHGPEQQAVPGALGQLRLSDPSYAAAAARLRAMVNPALSVLEYAMEQKDRDLRGVLAAANEVLDRAKPEDGEKRAPRSLRIEIEHLGVGRIATDIDAMKRLQRGSRGTRTRPLK